MLALDWRNKLKTTHCFPLAILIIGVLSVILESAGIQSYWSEIISGISTMLLTAVEILRTRGRMEKTAMTKAVAGHRMIFICIFYSVLRGVIESLNQ